MRTSRRIWAVSTALVFGGTVVAALMLSGCGGGGTGWEWTSTPWDYNPTDTTPTGPGSTGQTGGGFLGQNDRTPSDPCDEALSRKYITISMRNLSPDYIHYFFVAIAFIDVDETDTTAAIPTLDGIEFPNGAVCPNDVSLYTQSGYTLVSEGRSREFGDYCITGPALLYFHRNGQFRVTAGSGTAGLGSAIAPAQGTAATYDAFFTSSGAQLPAPDIIMFHNPGTGEGARLKISWPVVSPCSEGSLELADPPCERDAFYYVSDDDVMSGSRQLGEGSGRRVPAEIQGTACECIGVNEPFQILAPPRVGPAGATCQEFLRGGKIEYIFVRDDARPPYPQLLWRVTDTGGGVVHAIDPRATLPGG